MTSGNVNNFVSDLVLMAKAMEELPQVKQERDDWQAQAMQNSQAVQAREESILRLKQEIEALHAAKAKVEAERDDAELRFLEGEDRTRSALDFIKSTFGSAGSLIQALEPPAKAEPVAQPQAIDNPLYGDPDRYAVEAQPIPQPPAEHEHHYEPMPPQGADASQGQGAMDPTFQSNTSSPAPDAPSQQPVETSLHSANSATNVEVAPAQVDPTASTTTDHSAALPSGHNSTIEPAPKSESVTSDDVGYHNEPTVGTGPDAWTEWDKWQHRMNQRYPTGWPNRIIHPTN